MKKILYDNQANDYKDYPQQTVFIQQANYNYLGEISFTTFLYKDVINSQRVVAVFNVKRKGSEVKMPVKADTEIFAVN